METRVKLSIPALAALLLTAACDSPRDRPTGLAGPLPSTSVEVVEPENDEILKKLTRFETLQPSVHLEIEFDVPHLLTGVHLEIRAVAIDAIGDRHQSAPVFVQIIECDVFPLACREP